MMSNNIESVVSRLESVAARLERLPILSGRPADSDALDITVTEFDESIKKQYEEIKNFVASFDADVVQITSLIGAALEAERNLLVVATKFSRPSERDMPNMFKPLSEKINAVIEFAESHRSSKFMSHLFFLKEAIGALGWVASPSKPDRHIKESIDQASFYGNRILRDFKGKDDKQVDFHKRWIKLLKDLEAYCKDNHPNGLGWQADKPAATLASLTSGSSASGPAAPPPPPPPSGKVPIAVPAASTGGDSHSGLMEMINKGGENLTKGLRKVTDDMKTHKNPSLRAASTVPDKPKVSDKPSVAQKKVAPKQPVMSLSQDKKWIVEHYQDAKELLIEDTKTHHSIYIYNCNRCTITVKGKVNFVTLDSCTKTNIVLDELISSMDVVNCKSIAAQAMGKIPIVNIDKTDGAQVYLNKDSLDTEIISAKSSEMNVWFPDATGELVEIPVPEQFKSKFVDGKLKTTITESV